MNADVITRPLRSVVIRNNELVPEWFEQECWNEKKGGYFDTSTGAFRSKEEALSGVIAVADAIKANGALVNLNLSNNRIEGAEAGKALADALTANTVLKELDLSGGEYDDEQTIDAAFAKEFAIGLGANGALTSLDISGNNLCEESGFIKKKNHGLTEGDLIEYNGVQCPVTWKIRSEYQVLDVRGAIAIADAIRNAPLVQKLDISDTRIPDAVLQRITALCTAKSIELVRRSAT